MNVTGSGAAGAVCGGARAGVTGAPRGTARVVLVGSYNGQDSAGDRFLLQAAAARMRGVFGPAVRITAHLHAREAVAVPPEPGVALRPGLSLPYWRWVGAMRHLRLGETARVVLALPTLFPALARSRDGTRRLAMLHDDLAGADLLYFYGGTQLSAPWFRFNFPPLLLTFTAARAHGVPIRVGPQQFGPQTPAQRRLTRALLRVFARDVAVRNERCRRLLGLPLQALYLDEVFACRERFPSLPRRRARWILVNLRGREFLGPGARELRAGFASLVAALHRRTGLPVRVFAMSGRSFSDDLELAAALRQLAGAVPLETGAAPRDAQELAVLASEALGAVSMSFHGCVLAMIGGCPAVPVVHGPYYRHKYADFDRYTGGQGVPAVDLERLDPERDAQCILRYFADYDAARVASARAHADRRLARFHAAGAGAEGRGKER